MSEKVNVNVVDRVDRLSDTDRLTVELVKYQRHLAVANAKLALAEQEKTELSYKLMITQLFMKYGLSSEDSINENGEFSRAPGPIQPSSFVGEG